MIACLFIFDLLFGGCGWFDSVLFNADLCKLVLKGLFGFVLLGFGYFDAVRMLFIGLFGWRIDLVGFDFVVWFG